MRMRQRPVRLVLQHRIRMRETMVSSGSGRLRFATFVALLLLAYPVAAQVDMTGRWRVDPYFGLVNVLDFVQTGTALEATFPGATSPTFTGQFDGGLPMGAFTLTGPSFSIICSNPTIIHATLAADGETFSGTYQYPYTDFCYYASASFSGQRIQPGCGDTAVDPGEECDDGNTTDGDECDATCHIEPRLNGTFYLRNVENSGQGRQFDEHMVVVQTGTMLELRDPSTNMLRATGTFDPRSLGAITLDFVDEPCAGTSDGYAQLPSPIPPFLRPSFFVRGLRYFAAEGRCLVTDVFATRCGGGTFDPGEECDDGNVQSLDGCSSSCTMEPSVPCAATPLPCPGTVKPTATRLVIRGNRIRWTMNDVSSINPYFLSDPVAQSAWLFCLYDLSSGPPVLISAGRAGPDCTQGGCWKARDNGGFVYRNVTPRTDELSRWVVNPGPFGESSIMMKGEAPAITLPSLPLVSPVRLVAQLQVVDDTLFDNGCWEAQYTAAGVRRNEAGRLHVSGTP